MTTEDRLIRLEAMLAELLRIAVPEYARPFMTERLEAYAQAARAGRSSWTTENPSAESDQ